jgi:hypothetical protein
MPDVTIYDQSGTRQTCHCGAPATFVWSTWDGKQNYTCNQHNPMSGTAALPPNFTGHSLCPACGK